MPFNSFSLTNAKLCIRVGMIQVCPLSVSLVDPNIHYRGLLAQFPQIMVVEPVISIKNRGVLHRIITQGPPVAQRACWLHPKTYVEFRCLCEAGTCR